MYAAKYIKMAKSTVCSDLRKLVHAVFPNYAPDACYDKLKPSDPSFHPKYNLGRMHPDVTDHAHHLSSPLYWRFNSERSFVHSSFLMDNLLREHNERYFFLTAQNARIRSDVWVSCIMYRLGQHEGWTYIGMPTVICDAMAKVRKFALLCFACIA